MRIKRNPSRLALEITVALLLFAVLWLKEAGDFRIPVQIEITLQAPQPLQVRLLVNGQEIVHQVEAASGFQTLYFQLNPGTVRDLRLSFYPPRSQISIQRLAFLGFLQKRLFVASQITKISTTTAGFKKVTVGQTDVRFQPTDESAMLVFSANILAVIERLGRNRNWLLFRSLIIALSCLGLLHSLSMAKWQSLRNSGIIPKMAVFFPLLLLLPTLGLLLKLPEPYVLNERRKLADPPRFIPGAPCQFPAAFELYFNDHFRFRPLLIRWHNLSRVRLFGVSPIPQVLIGKNNWLFLAQENARRNVIDYYRAAVPLSPNELEAWCQMFQRRRDWLAAKGIIYLMAMVPDKSTIYPEFLPDRIRRIGRKSRLDQMVAHLDDHSQFRILDLRPALLAAKNGQRLFHRTDSHWNDVGAFIAYQQIIRELARSLPVLQPRPATDFSLRTETTWGGDLAIMLGIADVLREERITLEPRTPRYARASDPPFKTQPWVTRSASECPTAPPLKMVMFRDSFGHELIDYLAEHFSRVVFHWDPLLHFDTRLIETEKPAVVIEEMSERFLLDAAPPPFD